VISFPAAASFSSLIIIHHQHDQARISTLPSFLLSFMQHPNLFDHYRHEIDLKNKKGKRKLKTPLHLLLQ